jgi:gas vesicle protein
MNKSSKIALGILGAAAIGIIIGGLLYTEKGKEIREKIGSKATDAKDGIADLIRRGKEKASNVANQVSKQANGVKTSAEDFVA